MLYCNLPTEYQSSIFCLSCIVYFFQLQLLCIITENEADVAAFKDFEDSGEVLVTATAAAAEEVKVW